MDCFMIMHKPSTIVHIINFWDLLTLTDFCLLQYLDENKQLILAILENQNLGKLAECAQ